MAVAVGVIVEVTAMIVIGSWLVGSSYRALWAVLLGDLCKASAIGGVGNIRDRARDIVGDSILVIRRERDRIMNMGIMRTRPGIMAVEVEVMAIMSSSRIMGIINIIRRISINISIIRVRLVGMGIRELAEGGKFKYTPVMKMKGFGFSLGLGLRGTLVLRDCRDMGMFSFFFLSGGGVYGMSD